MVSCVCFLDVEGPQVTPTLSNTNGHNGHTTAELTKNDRILRADDDYYDKERSQTIKTWSESVLLSLTSPFRDKNPKHHTHYTTATLYHHHQPQNGSIATYENYGEDSSYNSALKSDIHNVNTVNDYSNQYQTIGRKYTNGSISYNDNEDVVITLPKPFVSETPNSLTNSTTDVSLLLPVTSLPPLSPIKRFIKEHAISLLIPSIFYFAWFVFIVGYTILHIVVYFLMLVLYLFNDKTRRFVLAFLPYMIYLLVYDSLRVVPNYSVSNIHTEDIYNIEKKLFGVYSNKKLLTLNEYFRIHHIGILDVLTGVLYLHWIPIPLLYSFYLYRNKRKRDGLDFAITFLLTNLIGFIIYYIIPTASNRFQCYSLFLRPPWYVELYGSQIKTNVSGNPAGFIYFEQITGLKIFSGMYAKNANVFAAIPSLHAAYPVLCVLYGNLSKKLWLQILFVLLTLGIWFSAVYSRHHYVLDVLSGGLCSVSAYFIYKILSTKVAWVIKFLNNYEKVI
ncbi:unnamed protein product [Didymodactylos carnosus]|uniref:Phosphatidic acid phosphatase type 2/haloperoxidase domain-containing protein n=2 Tax=Didymodactylos carnosus TaxID=1234261 RepID=A0A8S2GYA5_9BILA|nr:unnamed protein product [Didymodactylos carnosus]CAF3567823.1 unnamed protein product [Didymodactylos carnosus]